MSANGDSSTNDGGKTELHYEKLLFQVEKEKFASFMVGERNELNAEKRELNAEKRELNAEKREFDLEKEKFAFEKRQFHEQCQESTHQSSHFIHLTPFFGIIPDTTNVPTELAIECKEVDKHNDGYCREQNVLLSDNLKLVESLQQSVIEHGAQSAAIIDKAVRGLVKRAKVLDEMEAKIQQRMAKLEPFEEQLQQLRDENEQLKKNQLVDSEKKIHRGSSKDGLKVALTVQKEDTAEEQAKKRETWMKMMDDNAKSHVDNTEIWMFITIENLEKTIAIKLERSNSLIQTLWSDHKTRLSNVLKRDADQARIPSTLPNRLKLFVASRDLLVDGKEEWIQISGKGVELLPKEYTTEITPKSLVQERYYWGSTLERRTYDNDRCALHMCGRQYNGLCRYNDKARWELSTANSDRAHAAKDDTYSVDYHIKIKWHK